ncbi:MAG: MAPEG family protein [Halioglobus sp.]
MNDQYIFAPVVIQVMLTLGLYVYLAIAKKKAAKLGQVNEERRALHDDAWPDNVLQINNCIRNQFEVPLLFYVLIGVLWSLGAINIYVHLAAWLFVVSRIAHAVVHTGSNYVPLRRRLFMIGCYLLIGLAFYAAYKVI